MLFHTFLNLKNPSPKWWPTMLAFSNTDPDPYGEKWIGIQDTYGFCAETCHVTRLKLVWTFSDIFLNFLWIFINCFLVYIRYKHKYIIIFFRALELCVEKNLNYNFFPRIWIWIRMENFRITDPCNSSYGLWIRLNALPYIHNSHASFKEGRRISKKQLSSQALTLGVPTNCR